MNVALRVSKERIFTQQYFYAGIVGLAVHQGLGAAAPTGRSVASSSMGTSAQTRCIWASEPMARASSAPCVRNVRSRALALQWACSQAVEQGKPKLASSTSKGDAFLDRRG